METSINLKCSDSFHEQRKFKEADYTSIKTEVLALNLNIVQSTVLTFKALNSLSPDCLRKYLLFNQPFIHLFKRHETDKGKEKSLLAVSLSFPYHL